jgi:hypothetical protein
MDGKRQGATGSLVGSMASGNKPAGHRRIHLIISPTALEKSYIFLRLLGLLAKTNNALIISVRASPLLVVILSSRVIAERLTGQIRVVSLSWCCLNPAAVRRPAGHGVATGKAGFLPQTPLPCCPILPNILVALGQTPARAPKRCAAAVSLSIYLRRQGAVVCGRVANTEYLNTTAPPSSAFRLALGGGCFL